MAHSERSAGLVTIEAPKSRQSGISHLLHLAPLPRRLTSIGPDAVHAFRLPEDEGAWLEREPRKTRVRVCTRAGMRVLEHVRKPR